MAKRLWFIIGLVTGLLVGELLRRKQLQRLAKLEADVAYDKARFARYEQEWQEHLATLPTDERITWAMRDAERRHYDAIDGIIPLDDEGDKDVP